MPKIDELPVYTIEAADLADWLHDQPETWWTVDGDPLLMSVLDLPCPSDELIAALRKHPGNLQVRNLGDHQGAPGRHISSNRLGELAGHDAHSGDRLFAMQWENQTEPWLLVEEKHTSATSEESERSHNN
jgi:hypothetical protein